MTDTPGWASPGSTPSSEGREPADRPDPVEPAEPAAQPEKQPQEPGSKWSDAQPPAGQWSAPTAGADSGPTPPPAGPGWGGKAPGGPTAGPGGHGGGWGGPGGHGNPGGYGAWGGGWGGPPPAAKPGVIPLRPLGVGEILDGAVSTMRTYWRTVLGISLTVAAITQLCVLLLRGLVMNEALAPDSTLNDPSATPADVFRAAGEAMVSGLVVVLISVVGTIIATALLTTVTSRAVLGKPVSAGEAWRESRSQIPKLFGLLLLLGLIGAGVLLVGAVPGIIALLLGGGEAVTIPLFAVGVLGAIAVMLWLSVRFSLASPALMLERQGVVKSMRRSAKLVHGSWWRVLGIQLLAGLIANIVSSIVVIPFTFIAVAVSGDGMTDLFGTAPQHVSWAFLIISGIGAVIGTMVTLPITAGVTVLLYIDQRIRREALDLELARAAGVQDYGTAAAPGPLPGS